MLERVMFEGNTSKERKRGRSYSFKKKIKKGNQGDSERNCLSSLLFSVFVKKN